MDHRGGAPRRVNARAVELIRAAVVARPDIAPEELRLRLRRQARVRVSVSKL